MNRQYITTEYGSIRRAADYPGMTGRLTDLYVPDAAFDALKRLAADPEVEGILTFSMHRGRELLRTRNYVGLLETRTGIQLEILPKIAATDLQTDTLSVAEHRATLLSMIRHVRNSPFRQPGIAPSGAARLPLWESLITAFLNDVAPLVTQGLQRAYVHTEAELPVLKGKWRLADQLQRPHHAERFAVTYHAFTADIPPNRLLKACLTVVAARARTINNQTRIRQLLFALDEVSVAEQPEQAMTATRANERLRLRLRYAAVLRWTDILLLHHSVGVLAGPQLTISLLFPMERIFEEYVAAGFRRVVPADELSIQESSAYLVDDHGGNPKFKLRPDIIIRQNGQLIVLDTKWKRIDGTGSGTSATSYGIDQADLYQLYAYGKKYGATQLVLIYPASENFTQPLQLFGYDATLTLHVLPFDVTKELDDEVEKVLTATLPG